MLSTHTREGEMDLLAALNSDQDTQQGGCHYSVEVEQIAWLLEPLVAEDALGWITSVFNQPTGIMCIQSYASLHSVVTT